MLVIREAMKNEAVKLSKLALRSKAHWGYTNEFMELCKDELLVSENMIESNKCFIADNKKTIVGFYAIKDLTGSKIELDALFVEPKHIGAGIGRKLFEHAVNQARLIGGSTLIFQGDPNAENFYKSMGVTLTGKQESTCIPGRFLPTFSISLVNKIHA